MRAYKVSCVVVTAQDGANGDGTNNVVRFAGVQTDASAARRALVETYGVAFKSVTIEEVEVPTDKAGLLSFLNELVS